MFNLQKINNRIEDIINKTIKIRFFFFVLTCVKNFA